MDKLVIGSLKARARKTLENTTPDYRKLVLYHGAVSAGVLIVLALMEILVSLMDTNTGGLDSMGTGAMINTTLSSISTITSLVLPFWQVGILFTSLLVVRQKYVNFSMLTQGFRRVGPLLRYGILLFAIIFGICMAGAYVLTIYLTVVPMPDAVTHALEPLVQQGYIDDPYALLEMMPSEFWQYMIVPTILYIILVLAVVLYFFYRFRMCQYIILDGENIGARMSMGISSNMTKGCRWDLVKLDLSFWWFYVLQFLALLIAEIPVILQMCHISLPISETVASALCYLVYSGISLLILYYAGAYVETTYACAYEVLSMRQQTLATLSDLPPQVQPYYPEARETQGETFAIPEKSQELEEAQSGDEQ